MQKKNCFVTHFDIFIYINIFGVKYDLERFVCVCVVQVYLTVLGKNVPTKIISKMIVLVGTFFGLYEEKSL